MKVNVTALTAAGRCVAPLDWHTDTTPRPYRLYYVLGGEAYFRSATHEFMLEAGKLYLFPSTLPFIIYTLLFLLMCHWTNLPLVPHINTS